MICKLLNPILSPIPKVIISKLYINLGAKPGKEPSFFFFSRMNILLMF